ncbi:MAG: CRISPR-associated protein Cas4 [Cyclobacteriaceae bacterium]
MQVTGTYIAYLHTCHRKLWLFANGLNMEQTSDVVAEGKLIGETTYTDRAHKFSEIEIDGVKIDFYDARNKIVHEVKKSASVQQAHIAQVRYYLYKLSQKGIEGATGIVEYPRLKRRQEVHSLTPRDTADIRQWEKEVERIVCSPDCPPVIRAKICRQCSYYDFCYSSEPG